MARFLVTADVHLMRESSGCDGHGSARTWRTLCERAKEEKCDAILVAGDLLDAAVAYAPALRVVREGAKSFGGPILAVSGNHDAYHLPDLISKLADDLDVRLLGPNGKWGTAEVAGVRVAGWSYPVPRGGAPGRAAREAAFAPDLMVPDAEVAILHADVDGSGDAYHSVPAHRFGAHPGIGHWFLGHVHCPPADGPNWRYCGSPQALDPGETGDHGAVLYDTDRRQCEPIELSTVRYRNVVVDVTDASDLEEVEVRIANELDGHARDFIGAVRCRVRLEGRTKLRLKDLAEIRREETCERIEIGRLLPALDLEALAGETGSMRGKLARLVLDLEAGDATKYADLVARAQDDVARQCDDGDGHSLETLDPRERVRAVALRLLGQVG